MKTRLKVRSGRVSDQRLAQLPLQLKCSRRRHPILGLAPAPCRILSHTPRCALLRCALFVLQMMKITVRKTKNTVRRKILMMTRCRLPPAFLLLAAERRAFESMSLTGVRRGGMG